MPTLAKSYQQIKDNPELLAILAEKVKGKGPGGSDLPLESAILTVPMDDNGAQAGDFDAEPAPGTMRTISENMVGSLSTAIPTGLGALAVGAATTALTKKPLAGMGAGMVAGPILGKYATGPLGRVINKKVLPDIVNRDVEIQQQVNPVASTVGSALANLALQKPTFGKSAWEVLKNPKILTKPVDLGKLLSRDTTALESLKPLNLGVGIGGMAGTDIAMQAMEGQPIDWKRVGASAAMAPILGGGDFHGPIPKIINNRIIRPIAERQMAANAAEFNPVILKNPDGTLMDQETAKMYVLDLYDKDPTSQRFVEAKNELEQLTGYPLDIQNGLKWKKAILERRAEDAEKLKPKAQKVKEAAAAGKIAPSDVDPEFVKYLRATDGANLRIAGKRMTTEEAEEFARYPESAVWKAKWEAEVAAAEAAKAAEAAAKGTKKPKTSKESVASPAVGPAPIERTPSSAPISAEAKNLPTSTKSLSNRPQQTELSEIDLPIIEGWAKETMGNLPEETQNQLWQEQSGGLVDALSKFPPEIARDKAIVQKAWQTVLRLNRKQISRQVGGMSTDEAQARQIAESEGRAKVPDSEATRIDTENEPTPEPAPLSKVDETATAELSEKPLPKLVPNKQGPKYDPANPLPGQEHFDEDVLKPLGMTDEEYRKLFANDNWLPNHPSTPVEIVPSDVEGHGNVTTGDIPAGASIGAAFDVDPKNPKVGLQTQLGRFTNHSRTPNAEIVVENRGLVLKAKEDLPAGTELFVDYRDALPKIRQYQTDLAEGKAGLIRVTKKGTPYKPKGSGKTKKAKPSAAVPAKPTTAVVPDVISPAATETETTKPTVEPQPNVAAGEPTNPAAQYKAIGDFVASVKELDALPQDVSAADLQAAQTKSKAAASILRESHSFSEDELNDLAKITYDKLDEHGGDVNKATEAAFKELGSSRVSSETVVPGTPYKPAIKGDVGSVLGAVPEMYRATKNVTGQVYTKAKDYLEKINKGFSEGRTAADRPEFIRSSVIDTLRPGVLKMGLDKDGKYNGDELLGRLSNTMNPVERQVLMDNGLEGFLKGQRRSPDEVAKFMEENGPQVEVKKLYAHNAKVDEARQNIANLRHQIENLGYQIEGNRNEGVMYYRNGEEVPFESMPKEHQKLVTEFEDAVPPNWERDPESATARYTMVNPKELSKMPGAVDILVRVPAPEDKPGYKGEVLPYKYRSPHYPQEGKNLLAHVRGYMETLPDGRKVFHVFEVQSDWAQQRRDVEKEVAALRKTAKIVDLPSGEVRVEWGYNGQVFEGYPGNKENAIDNTAKLIEHAAANDPLLKDYNRLALKAAIEHAYREGADAIAISDAETAMMTEMHDQNAANALAARVDLDELTSSDVPGRVTISQEPGMRFNYDPNPTTAGRSGKPGALHELAAELTKYPGERVSFGEHKNAFSETTSTSGPSREINKPEMSGKSIAEFDSSYEPQRTWLLTGKFKIRNEPGYVPDLLIQVEIPASKYSGKQTTWIQSQVDAITKKWNTILGLDKEPRKNLIFKNPDGSPKTDISAVLYPIDKVAAKLDVSSFAVSGKGPKGMELYSFPGPLHTVIGDIVKNTLKLGGKVAYKGTERFLEGAGERLSRTAGPSGGYFREHVRSFFRFERQLQNEFLEPVFKASDIGLTKAQREKVGKYAYDMDEYGASPIALSSDELKVYNLVRASFDSSRIAQRTDGPYQNGKPVSGPTKNFMPQSILSKEVRRVLNSTDRADYAAQKHYQELYEQWYRSKSPKRDSVSEADYVARIHDSLGELLGKDPFMGKKNPTFTPLYEHEGIGLPPSMRETDIIDVAGHYGRRWAAGLAWYRSVQKDPIMARIMGVEHNGRGADYVPATRDILPSDSNPQQYEIRDYSNIPEYARNLSGNPDLEPYRAQMFRGATQHYDITDRLTAVANSAMLGPLTAFRDVVSSSLGSLGEVAKVSDIPAWTKAWGKVLSGESTAQEAGAVRGRNTAEFAIDNSVRKIDGKIADVLRKYQGRDLMEKGIREVLFELGKEMASNRLASRATDTKTITANNKFFETYGGKDWKKLSTEDLLDTVGSNVMEQMQGSFTPEYLPRVLSVGAGPSYTKAMFSLSRWGVERFRRYRQTVIKPIAEDGNILPLVKSTALYLGLATPAVNALVEVLTHKKPKNSTWPEYLNLVKDGKPDAHLMDEFAYDFLANANLAGMGGILGGLVYQGMQLRHGERAMGYNSPGVSTLVDMGKRVIDYCEVYSGKDLFLNLWRLPTETALQEIQTLRLIKNALDDRPDTGNREEQIYERVRGKTKFGLGDKATANPFSPLTAIRRASTVEDIMGQEPGLEKLYQRTNPEKAGRFHNPLRLPPSPEDAVAGENYYRFTTAMQTPEELANDPRGLSPASAGGKQLQRDAAQMGLNQVRAGVANVAWNRARARNLLERVRARGQ